MILKFDNPLDQCELKFDPNIGEFHGYASVLWFGGRLWRHDSQGRIRGNHHRTGQSGAAFVCTRPIQATHWARIKSLIEDEKGLLIHSLLTPGQDFANEVTQFHAPRLTQRPVYRVPHSGGRRGRNRKRRPGDFNKIDLREISVVVMPAEDTARIDMTTVKSMMAGFESLKDCEHYLRESGWSRNQATMFVGHMSRHSF